MMIVSAIITTHNRRELLNRAIKSVFAQTYPEIELIVVDDHSDDDTKEVCQDPRINYIYIPKEESHGGNYARNLGIKASKGKYCAFLDDDDYWLPTKIEKQVALIEKMDCELVYCGRRLEFVSYKGVGYKDVVPSKSNSGDMHQKIMYTICTTTTCILAKREALFDIGLFDEDLMFWQEYELTIRLAQRKPFFFINEPLVVYRIDKGDRNRLTNKYFEWLNAVEYVHQKHRSLYLRLNLYQRYKVKNLVWRDAVIRCKSAGLSGRMFVYFLLTLPMKLIQFPGKVAMKIC